MKNLSFLFLFLFTFNFLLNAQTANLSAVKDNTIYSNLTTNSNGAGDNFTAGANQSAAVRRGLLMFDLSSIPAGATITAVSLSMVMNKTVSGANNVSLHRLDENWGEGPSNAGAGGDGNGAPAELGDATWICSFSNGAGGCTTAWTTAGGTYQPTATATTSVAGPSAYTWSSAQMITNVQGWLNTPATNFGWVIIGTEGSPGSAKRFSSRTNPIVPDRPSLTVTYTAPPCTSNTWTGSVNTSWETPGNWSCGVIPDATMDVIISSGTVVLNSNRSCRSINVSPGVIFTVNAPFVLTVVH